MTYYNVVTTMLNRRFADVCKEIEDLAEKENGPPGSKNNALMTLYAEHNEACELVDEANTFWQAYVFFSYTRYHSCPLKSIGPFFVMFASSRSYIPLTCYALYNVFFADFDDLLGPVTWTCFGQTIFLVGFVSVSAAKVSAEVSSPISPCFLFSQMLNNDHRLTLRTRRSTR